MSTRATEAGKVASLHHLQVAMLVGGRHCPRLLRRAAGPAGGPEARSASHATMPRRTRTRLARSLMQGLGLTQESLVVELGCWTRQFTVRVAPVCARVIAVDARSPPIARHRHQPRQSQALVRLRSPPINRDSRRSYTAKNRITMRVFEEWS